MVFHLPQYPLNFYNQRRTPGTPLSIASLSRLGRWDGALKFIDHVL